MTTWHVRLTFSAAEPFDEDTPFDVSDQLEEFAAVLSVSRAFDAGNIAMTVEAETAVEASRFASSKAAAALQQHGITATITGLQAQSPEEFEEEMAQPIYPRVVGYAEIAEMAGVSRQRARQFADKQTFPHPVIATAQGPLFNYHAIEQWLTTRETPRPGRPKVSA